MRALTVLAGGLSLMFAFACGTSSTTPVPVDPVVVPAPVPVVTPAPVEDPATDAAPEEGKMGKGKAGKNKAKNE